MTKTQKNNTDNNIHDTLLRTVNPTYHMGSQTVSFEQPTLMSLTGRTATGQKKVQETVTEVKITKRSTSCGFSWTTPDGTEDSISFQDDPTDILPEKLRTTYQKLD